MRELTFFCVVDEDVQTMKPVADAAHRRGFKVRFESDINAPADIGFYCQHWPDPKNSNFSLIMLHDIGQEYWPGDMTRDTNHWCEQDWSNFDIAFLPGKSYSDDWKLCKDNPRARPRIGVFEVGFPKSDSIFSNADEILARASVLKADLGLKEPFSILFAPSSEYDDFRNLEKFYNAFSGQDFNLMIKYAPSYVELPEKFSCFEGLYFIDSELHINDCLAISDIVVSDESNCMAEALLFGIPTISLIDLRIPLKPQFGHPERPCIPPSWAIKVESFSLHDEVNNIIKNFGAYQSRFLSERSKHFSHLGNSSNLILDILESYLNNTSWPISPLQ